jgi:membrane-associated progesterone receptor component
MAPDQVKSALLSNPLNTALALVIVYLLASLVLPYNIEKLTPSLAKARSPSCNHTTSYSYLPDHPPVIEWKKYTPRTLAVHDGSDVEAQSKKKAKNREEESRILLAISGKVFDVTKGGHFYGPGEYRREWEAEVCICAQR